ncbi:MAG TPA: carboxypeptidase-like regulatory domain-containing protein [Thermoanaerobaculia bacterium]|jgi:hypothetical protein
MLPTFLLAAVLNGTVMLHPQSGAGEPVGGALVELLQDQTTVATATSATDGTFSIPDLVTGTYSIRLSSDHTETRGTIVVHDDGAPRTFYVFDAPCGAIFGRVDDAVTGLGVPHASVDILGSSGTDANGDYFISFGCEKFSGYKFSGTSGVNVTARHYRNLSYYFRSEHVDGFAGNVLDFDLQPLATPPPRDRLPRR